MAKELMLRRVAVTLLMMVYVAGQLAMAAHLHAQDAVGAIPGHAERPHVHVGHAHNHRHDHDHGDTRQGYANSSQDASTDQAATASGGHDQDALYLPGEIGPLPSEKAGASADAAQAVMLLSLASVVTAPPPTVVSQAVVRGSSAAVARACPLYLALRALRI